MKTLKLYEMFNSDTLRNRSTAASIVKDMAKFKSEKIIFDFENISFISRSFAHELLSNLKEKDIDFQFVNTNHVIDTMFRISSIKPKFVFSTPVKKKIEIKA